MEEEGEGPVDALAFPLLAQGHIIPFMRLCELLSSKNLNVVFLTSPLNANRLRTKNNDSSSSPRVRVMDIPLPPVPGLPAGAENTDQLTSGPQFELLFAAIENMEPSFTKLVARLRPKCLIADLTPLFLPAVAQKLKIPVFFYATTGAYSLTMMEAVTNSLPLPLPLPTGESTAVLPALPKPVSFNDRDFLHPFRGAGRASIAHRLFSMFFEHIRRSAGLVMNTFEEMDAGFVDHVRNAFRVPVWSVGPVLNRPSDTEWGLVEQWLDCRVAGSVVYVNFGSEIALSGEQIKEVAAGLEASGQCFVWAVKKPPAGEVPEAEGDGVLFTVPTGFEERTADRGLLIAGWAPQQ